jgi:hypothetical protein
MIVTMVITWKSDVHHLLPKCTICYPCAPSATQVHHLLPMCTICYPCAPSATHVPCVHPRQNKVFVILPFETPLYNFILCYFKGFCILFLCSIFAPYIMMSFGGIFFLLSLVRFVKTVTTVL